MSVADARDAAIDTATQQLACATQRRSTSHSNAPITSAIGSTCPSQKSALEKELKEITRPA
ncbi:MAG: hypothetical protein ACHQ7M_10155, partial [Chloroflexota bacterium]